MNINDTTHSYLLSMLQTLPMEKATQVIEYRFANPSRHWLLPLHSCQAFKVNEIWAIPAISSLIALQTSILLVDDLLDNDGRRETLGLSVGETANLSTVFQAIGIDCICKNFSTNEKQIEVIDQINKMMLETAYGQYLDDQIIDTEATYWRAARAKSCPFFGLAFYLGAIASGASPDTAEAILKLGRLYGEMVQIHDDLSDSFADDCGSDWLQRKSTLPILFARVVNHPEQMRFMTLLENITNLDQVREAQGILLRCGAVSYCLNEIVQRDKIGKQFLADLNLPNSEPLDQVFDHIVTPIWELLKINLEIS